MLIKGVYVIIIDTCCCCCCSCCSYFCFLCPNILLALCCSSHTQIGQPLVILQP